MGINNDHIRILNPDQKHPFFLDFQNDREKGVSDSASNLLKKILKQKMFPYFQPIIVDATILLLSAAEIGVL